MKADVAACHEGAAALFAVVVERAVVVIINRGGAAAGIASLRGVGGLAFVDHAGRVRHGFIRKNAVQNHRIKGDGDAASSGY